MCNVFFACKKSDAALDVPLSDLRRHKIISEGEHNMNYTKNYRLPQWVKEDRIMMDDFNAMNTSIESGMTKTAATANAARADASEAKQTADAAQQTAGNAYCPDNKPYTTGTYTGNGGSKDIHLGFRPSFVIISGMKETFNTNNLVDIDRFTGISSGGTIRTRVKFSDTGFTVLPRGEGNHYLPDLNEEGRVYDYIAFK